MESVVTFGYSVFELGIQVVVTMKVIQYYSEHNVNDRSTAGAIASFVSMYKDREPRLFMPRRYCATMNASGR